MLGFSSGGILDCREHEPNPRITQITADELLVPLPARFVLSSDGVHTVERLALDR
jgi:hypothetical protein